MKLSVKEAVKMIMTDKKQVQDVLPKVEESKRDDVLRQLRAKKNLEKGQTSMEDKKKMAEKMAEKEVKEHEKKMHKDDMKKMMGEMYKKADMEKEELMKQMCKKYGCSTEDADKAYKGMMKMKKSLQEVDAEVLEKAMKAGYDAPIEQTETEAKIAAEQEEEQQEAQASEKTTEETQEPKFADGLFSDFRLSASLEQVAEGTSLGVKESQHQNFDNPNEEIVKKD